MHFREAELTPETEKILMDLSGEWERENSCYGYVANGPEDLAGSTVFLAYEHETVIGYLFGQFFLSENMQAVIPQGSKCFEVDELYVAPAHRSRGVGKALFSFAEERIREHAEYIVLSTATKNWKAVFHFYIDELGMTFWSARLFKKLNGTNESEG